MSPATATEPVHGIPQHGDAESALPPTPREEIDRSLRTLGDKKDDWARLPIPDRRAILGELMKDFGALAEPWAEAAREAEGIPAGSPTAGEEWVAGPYMIVRNLRLLDQALAEIERYGQPQIPGPVTTRAGGQVVARVFPQSIYDHIFYSGITAEVWMEPGVTAAGLAETQATAYKERDPRGEVCLVLGAGNVSSIGPMDLLYKLFVENKVVVLKVHPVNDYLGPLVAEGFQTLRDWGVLRIVYGGVAEGAYLCAHEAVDEIHVTGSDKTVEAIVFGPGEEGRRRKAERRPKLRKPVSSELGNVSAVIVVPGPWSAADVDFQAEQLASTLTNNAGFNCNATRVIVTYEPWVRRRELIDGVRRHLAAAPLRKAYYPGAGDRHAAFLAAHPEAEQFGTSEDGELPWTLIAGVDAAAEDDICFHTEAFCGVTSETALAAGSIEEFIGRAVELANERLWGTLNCTLLVHPSSLADRTVGPAVERAIEELCYGTVTVNCWAAVGYGLVLPPWGAYPGSDVYDIQSGSGVVHNTLMFDRPQKTVVRAPFRMTPKPLWFQSHRTGREIGEKLTRFEAEPSPWQLPGILWEALRG